MEVVILPTPADCGRVVADVLAAAITSRATGSATLGLATGPRRCWRTRNALIRRHRDEGLSFAGVRAFLLDEYVGLPPDHPESYRSVIRRSTPVGGHRGQRRRAPDGSQPTHCWRPASTRSYVRGGGPVAVQLLGIGANDYIGFNEPGILAVLRHPGEDPHRADPPGQRPLLRGPRTFPGTSSPRAWASSAGHSTCS